MPVSEQSINSKLEAARRELLDLSLRNPLLNYRPLKSRGVEVVNEIPAAVFRILVKEGKAMSFLPIDAKTAVTAPAVLDLPGLETEPTPAQTDNKLQTRETPAKLDARLLDTYHSARMFMEEQGVSILYLSLGSLSWYETENSAEERAAPLILVPVELARTSARERFQLRYTGGEIGANLSLMARLKTDFDIDLPELPEAEEINVGQYFDEVWRRVVGRKGWVINSKAISLGFFSFGKFLMYNDLDAQNWPDTGKPHVHPVISALLQEAGFDKEPAAAVPEDAHLDQFLISAETRQVVDADSSQTLAILDVNQGRNLVIQGPPGTGKSQTITNLIAEALGKGKTVLFVAEKMAALEVVKRRLDKVGLGVACLELHSHKTNKKDLLLELSRTLELGKPKDPALETEIKLLDQMRTRLNDYAAAVNTPVGVSGLTVYELYGRLIRHRKKYINITLPRLALPALLAWSRDEFSSRDILVDETQARLVQMGSPGNLLFWGSRRKSFLPSDQNRLAPALAAAAQAMKVVGQTAEQLARAVNLPIPETLTEAESLSKIAHRLLQSPPYQGVNIRSSVWRQQANELQKLVTAGAQVATIRRQHENVLLPEAWEAPDLLTIRQDLMAYGTKWWKFLAGPYRASKKRLTGLTLSGLPASNDAQLTLVNAVLEAQRQNKIVNQSAETGQEAFGRQWRGEDSDWSRLNELNRWAAALHQAVEAGELPVVALDFLAQEPDLEKLKPLQKKIEEALQEEATRRSEALELLQLNEAQRFGEGHYIRDLEFTEQETLYTAWHQRLDELHEVVAWNNLAGRLQEAGLQEVVNLAVIWPEANKYLMAAFGQSWLEAWLEKAYEERPALLHFERASHEDAIGKFSRLDTLLLAYNQARLAALHWHQLPLHQAGGQLGVLRREFEKKARHLPIRQLMTKAGNAIQSIKPVFMMGPLSIANYLPPESLSFDLVIFDEASQVKPVDAFGAILRAGQVVVVGDSKQMPPTSFFDALIKEEEAEEENIVTDVESILGLFSAQGAPQRMLRWHYRSRHESLIAVSNQEFYDNRLVIFPSPDAGRQKTGLVYHHLPDTFYDRGKTRSNPQEAEKVAAAIMAHARTSPELSLGVAAFSMAQMQAIINHLEVMRREEPALEAYFMSHPNEPFFIKNLENVQGDERDVIFISIGYGRTEEGSLSMSFGPLNGMGGERRLNVLITRARLRCEVFTNLSPDDIDLTRTQARGVQAFKTFLSYAKNGQGPLTTGREQEAESLFESSVSETLRQAGYEVVSQVGSAGFSIDLAVLHPQQPGRYLLGIACDGASYHHARSARDRDRLRQLVLAGLGWQIYRIWSTDWFRNPAAEQKRLLQAVEKALQEAESGRNSKKTGALPDPAPAIIREEIKTPAPGPILPLYQMATLRINTGALELHELPGKELAQWVTEVVRVESPVHVQDVMQRLTEAAGVTRLGPRVRTALDSAISTAVLAGDIRQENEVLWQPDMQHPPLRDRSQLPAAARNLEYIAPQEVNRAIQKVIGDAFGLTPAEVAPAVARLLGFPRCTDTMREQIDLLTGNLLRENKLIKQEEHLFLPRQK